MFCRKHDCKWIGGLLWLFTAFLAVLLFVQIPLVALLTLDRELSVPKNWVERAINHSLGQKHTVSLGAATLNRDGTIELGQVTVRNELGRRVARIETLSVDFFLPSIIFGGFHPEQVKAAGIELFDPTGPLGTDERVVSVQALNLIRMNGFWQLDDFRGRWKNLTVVGAGTLNLSLRESPVSAPAETANPLLPFLESANAFAPQLNRFKKPFIRIHLRSSAEAETQVTVALIADRAELPFQIGLEDEIRLTGSALLSPDRIIPGPASLRCGRILYQQDTTVLNPTLRLTPSGSAASIEGFLADFSAGITASTITSPEITLEYPTLNIRPGRPFRLKANGQAGIYGNPFAVAANVDLLRRSANIDLAGVLSVNEAVHHPLLPEEARDFPLEFRSGVYLNLSTKCDSSEPIPKEIQFHAETESFDLKGFTGVHAHARGFLYPREMIFRVDKLSVQKTDYHMQGTYLHNFLSNEFRFRVRGGFLPMDISTWMSDWWDKIWANFVIYEVPYADFDIRGDWDHHDDRQIFGGFRFRDIVLKGMSVDSGYASMRSRPYLFELFDLRAFRSEGEASGSIAILNDWETRENKLEIYEFTSSFHLAPILPLFGEQLEKTLSDFDLTDAPDLTVLAKMRPETKEDSTQSDYLSIRASTNAPLTYRGIQLEKLSLSAVYANNILRLDPVRFVLGGGSGEGWLVRRPESARQGTTSARLSLKNGIPSEVVAAIPRLAEMIGDRVVQEKRTDRENYNLDFEIELSGDLEKPETLIGEGSINLLSPNLANIRLLGILSRISEELPLPITLGSFQFERVATSFLLNRGLIEFPNLSLYSPSSELLASGAYNMKQQTIDFNAQVQLLGAVKFPILAQLGTLLSPMGKVFEFRVWGDLEDLNWRLYLDPRSWE